MIYCLVFRTSHDSKGRGSEEGGGIHTINLDPKKRKFYKMRDAYYHLDNWGKIT